MLDAVKSYRVYHHNNNEKFKHKGPGIFSSDSDPSFLQTDIGRNVIVKGEISDPHYLNR